jgi:type IV pilus assembly protein PilA
MLPSRLKKGFTLIELLIVVVIIGILSAIAIPKFQNTKGKGYAASLKSDLRNLSASQESYFYYNETYTPDPSALNFDATKGVTLTIVEASPRGWSARTTHPAAAPLTCAVFYGDAALVAPATAEGQVACR